MINCRLDCLIARSQLLVKKVHVQQLLTEREPERTNISKDHTSVFMTFQLLNLTFCLFKKKEEEILMVSNAWCTVVPPVFPRSCWFTAE